MPERTLLADAFPVEVVLPDQRVERRCRVFIFDDGVVIYQERAGQPQKIFAERHREEPTLPPRHTPKFRWRATVRTVLGDVYVNKTGGCGCHSSLMQLRPEEVT